MSQATIEELSGRLLDDDLSEIEIDGLIALMRANDSDRIALGDQLRTAELLTQAYDDVRAAERFTAALESRLLQTELSSVRVAADDEDFSAALPAESYWLRGWQSLRDVACNYSVLSSVVSGLFITTILLSLALWTVPEWRPALLTTAEPTAVAKLVDTHEAVWSDGQFKLRRGEYLLDGDQLELVSGVAEIAFDDGAVVMLRGPASLLIQGRLAVRLQRGELVARVDAPAQGFAVDTPAGTFVDLGTEFAIAVGENDRVEAHVFEGLVEARLSAGAGQPTVHQLRAGEALRVEAAGGSVTKLPAQARGFVRDLPRWESIPIENFSFEEPGLGSGHVWSNGVAGWHGTENCGVSRFGHEFSQPTPHGEQTAFLNSGSLSQQLPAALAGDTQYRLSVWIGNRPGVHSPDYTIELYAGKALLASTSNDPQPAKGAFAQVVLEFTCEPAHPAIGEPLLIKLISNGSLATNTQNHFDAVQLLARPYVAGSVAEN